MKSLFVAAALIVTASLAHADIARPGNVSTTNLTGARAQKLYNAIKAEEQPGDVLRTQSSTYKVYRSENGLDQTVCEKIVYQIVKKPTTYRCVIQKSLDGQQIPIFIPPVRVG